LTDVSKVHTAAIIRAIGTTFAF